MKAFIDGFIGFREILSIDLDRVEGHFYKFPTSKIKGAFL